MAALTFALLASLPHAASAFGRTFGVGRTADMGFFCKGERMDTVVLNHTVSPQAAGAVLHHFWATGPQVAIDRIWVSVYVDGEESASLVFQPSMLCGVAFPEILPTTHLFSAGMLCGKGAAIGGFYSTMPIPFKQSVVVTARPAEEDGKCIFGYMSVRGTEDLPLALPGSGVPLPKSARLQLTRNDWAVRKPFERVNASVVEEGKAGVLLLTSFATSAKPVGGSGAGGGFIEGCWNFYGRVNEPYPGLVVGTGVEDYFDSSYYFGADSSRVREGVPFASPLAGLTVFNRTKDGYERLSAYRVHSSDPLSFTDGGALQWQVGGVPGHGRSKCGMPLHPGDVGAEEGRALTPVNVTTYGWAYVWPKEAKEVLV